MQTVWKKGYRWLCNIEQPKHTAAEQKGYSPLIVVVILVVIFTASLLFGNRQAPPVKLLETRTLTSLPGMENKGALSNDGGNAIFQYREVGEANNTLLIQDIAGGVQKPLVEPGKHFAPVFSDDGNRVAFMQFDGENCKIMIKGLVSGKQSGSMDCSGSSYPDLDWHEQSGNFALGLRPAQGQPVAIYTLDADGNKRQLTHPPKGSWGDFDPAISPDGKRLTFTRAYTEMQHDLFKVDVADGKEQRLTTKRAAIMGSSWTPDGEAVVYATRPRVGYRLYQLNMNTLESTRLNLAASEIIEPFIAKNGDLLATVRHFDSDIYRVAQGSEIIETLFDSTHWDLSPTISPNGKRFVFTSDRNGLFQLWLGDLVNGNTRPLTQFDGNYVVAPRFSPDSRRVVFEVHDGDSSQIYTYDLTSSLLLKLTEHQSLNVVPSISSDGSSIYFASDRSGDWQVWQKPLDGGQTQQLTQQGGYTALQSLDGRWLYFNKRNEAGIWRMNLKDKTIDLVTDKLGVDDVGAFAVVADGVLYLERSSGRFGVINKIDEAGVATTIYVLDAPMPRFDPVLSVDLQMKWLYLVKNNPVTGDLVRINKAFAP